MNRFFSRFIVLVLLTTLTYTARSQNSNLSKANAAYEKGDRALALDLFLKAYEKDPENLEINFKLGKLYLETIYRYKSLPYLEKVYAKNPSYDKELNKHLGYAYQFNHIFDKAKEHYALCRTTLPKEDPFIQSIPRKLMECDNGKEFVSHPVDAQIVNLGPVINTSFAEYGPIVSAAEDELIFTSRREGSTGGDVDEEGDFYEDIYISTMRNGEWTKPRQIGTEINTPVHDASIGLSADGRTMFIYKSEGNGDIYSCRMKRDSSWGEPVFIGGHVNTKKYYENAAAISPDGKIFFFSSTRPGGHGNLDIYMCIRDGKGNWGEPINLGKTINTEFDEEGPVLDLDGKTLYFSSIGHKCMGGFDIFKTVYNADTKTWSEPVNMGYPINSADDDIYFTLSGDGRHAYYASVKEGGYGEKDIYKITMPQRDDYQDLVSKVNAIVKLTQLDSDKDVMISNTDPALKSSFENISDSAGLLTEESKIKMQKIKADSLQVARDLDEQLKLKEKNAVEEERKRLEKLKSDSLMIAQHDPQIKGNTKALSEDSRMRFQKLKDACISISKDVDDKLKARDKELLDEEKLKLARIKNDVLKLADDIDDILKAGIVSDESVARIKYEKIKSNFDLTIKVADDRLLTQQKVIEDENFRIKEAKRDSLKEAQIIASGNSKENGGFMYRGVLIRNIYFDLDKAVLRPESITELEKILKIMTESPSCKLQINGHACGLGSREYNVGLSARRNQSVINWLTQHGIAPARITPDHHGEDKPLASNTIEKDGRELNRRVEFKILE